MCTSICTCICIRICICYMYICRPRTAVVQVLGNILSHDPDIDTVSENRHSGRRPNKQYSGLGLFGSFHYTTRPIIVSFGGTPPQKGASNCSGLPKPNGPKDPNNRVLGPKYYNIHGIWALKPKYLGPWTLREMSQSFPTST